MVSKATILKVQDNSRFRVFKIVRNISAWTKSTLYNAVLLHYIFVILANYIEDAIASNLGAEVKALKDSTPPFHSAQQWTLVKPTEHDLTGPLPPFLNP